MEKTKLKRKRSEYTYTTEQMKSAVSDVQAKQLSMAAASKKYGIPFSSLYAKCRKSSKLADTIDTASSSSTIEVFDIKPLFLQKHEEKIVEDVIELKKAGFFLNENQLVNYIFDYTRINNVVAPFNDNQSRRAWMKLFHKRNPNIYKQDPKDVNRMTNIMDWFEQTKRYVVEKGGLAALEDANRMFDFGEMRFFFNPIDDRNVMQRDDRIKAHNDNKFITTMIGVQATGQLAVPIIIVKDGVLPDTFVKTCPKWDIGMTDDGWMNASLFHEYITDTFDSYLNGNHVKLPVVVFCPKHFSANINTKTLQFCKDKGIILVCLPSILSVINALIVQPLRKMWPEAILEWKTKSKAPEFTRMNFCPLLKALLKNSVSIEMFQKQFAKHHLFPFGHAEDVANPEKHDADGQDVNTKDFKRSDLLLTRNLLVRMIDGEKMANFCRFYALNRQDEEWDGDLADKNLYVIWKELVDRCKRT